MYADVSDISYIAESVASWEKESDSVAKLWASNIRSYEKRRLVFLCVCEIPDTLLCVKRQLNAQEETLALCTSAAAAKRRRRQEDAQQRDSRLALARLAHSLASNLHVPLLCHQGSIMEAQSSERRCRRSTVEMKPAFLAGFSASI